MDMKKSFSLTKPSSNISSLILKLLFLVIMAFTVAGLAKLYSYFKVGAEKTDLISTVQQDKGIHDPTYNWDISNIKEGVILDEYTRQEVQDAYTYAWYILNTSIGSQKNLGLEDRFSKKMIDKIEKAFKTSNDYNIERVELNHNINVHLFSYDRQIISFSDNQVKLYTSNTQAESGHTNLTKNIANYDVVMGLEDGYWKIFDLIQLESPSIESKTENLSLEKVELADKIRGINYYPSDNPWFDFWKNYNTKTVAKDIELLKNLNFNHTRIFIPYELFGKGSLDKKMLTHLDDYLQQCKEQNISVTLSLFDFPESYKIPFYSATHKHLLQLLDRYQDHPAVSIWDIKNEPDLDFASYGQEVVVNWLEFIIDEAKEKAPNINLTIGWSKVDYIEILADKLDLQSFHLYGDIDLHQTHLQKLKKEEKIIRPLYLSEFGQTTFRSKFLPFGSTEKQQAIFTRNVLNFMAQENIDHYAYWTLHDFKKAPKEIIGWKPWIRSAQENMGLITRAGTKKITSKNFTEGEYKFEELTFLDKLKPSYFILAFLLAMFFLVFYKSK